MLVRPAIIFLLIAAFGCQSFRKNINATSKTSPSLTDSISITLKALNLSEDMSRLSTKNDELNLLIYPIANDSIKPVISSTRKTVYLSDSIQTVIPFTEQVLLVVIEEDHDVPFANISEMVRLNFDSLQNAFDQKDYNKIEQYIYDEDILLIQRVDLYKKLPYKFTITNTHRLDTYSYHLLLKRQQ